VKKQQKSPVKQAKKQTPQQVRPQPQRQAPAMSSFQQRPEDNNRVNSFTR